MKNLILIVISLIAISCNKSIIPESQKVPVDPLTSASKINSEATPSLWKNWYIDSDKDGYGSNIVSEIVPKNPLWKKKQPLGYVDNNLDCNDSDSLINPSAKDLCNIDMNCNGIPSEEVILNTFYSDKDGDTFGDSLNFIISCFSSIPNHVLNKLDCNDYDFSINPKGIEKLNEIDDDCDGEVDEGLIIPGLILTKTKKSYSKYFGTGGTSAMFATPVNDPKNQDFIDKMLSWKFAAYVGPVEGHESEYSHYYLPYGSKGSGYNPPLPCDPRPMNGELCKTYSQDFFLSWTDLCKKTKTQAIYVANIQTGKLEDIYYFLGQFSSQDTVIIAYGLEGPTSNYPVLNSKTYVVKYYQWMDSVNKHYPNRKIYHLADIPDVKKNPTTGKYNPWVQDFINYRPIDSTKVSLRSYYHFYEQPGEPLTRDAIKDSAIYSKGISGFVKTITDMEAVFKGCSNMVMQFSTDNPVYISGVPPNWRCVDMFWYLRAHKVMIDRNVTGQSNFLGTSLIGVKSMYNTLNYHWVSILNLMYLIPKNIVNIAPFHSQVDILAGYYGNTYSLVVQNRSGKPVAIPEYFSIDGKNIKPQYTKVVGYACPSLSSTTGSEFNPLTKGFFGEFSIVYLEF